MGRWGWNYGLIEGGISMYPKIGVVTQKTINLFNDNQIQMRVPYHHVYHLNSDVFVEPFAAFETPGFFNFGAFSYSWSGLPLSTTAGRYCAFAGGIRVMGNTHPMEWVSIHPFMYSTNTNMFNRGKERNPNWKTVEFNVYQPPISIGNDVWIGQDVLLKGGVTIGDGAIIGAGTTVSKDVPPYAVVVGNPGRIVKYRFSQDVIEKMLESKWWEYHYGDFAGLDFKNPEAFLERFNSEVKGKRPKFDPEKINVCSFFE